MTNTIEQLDAEAQEIIEEIDGQQALIHSLDNMEGSVKERVIRSSLILSNAPENYMNALIEDLMAMSDAIEPVDQDAVIIRNMLRMGAAAACMCINLKAVINTIPKELKDTASLIVSTSTGIKH